MTWLTCAAALPRSRGATSEGLGKSGASLLSSAQAADHDVPNLGIERALEIEESGDGVGEGFRGSVVSASLGSKTEGLAEASAPGSGRRGPPGTCNRL